MLKRKLYRDLRQNLSQFIVIFVMVMLSVMAFAGVHAYMDGMRVSGDKYYAEYNLADMWLTGENFSAEDMEKIYGRFPRLAERKNQIAGTLSGGEQQMLAMGRALMSRPKLIVMDEPSMGLSPILVSEIFDIITSIRKDGTTVLLVEQNAKKALSIADRAYVLETGNITLSGKASDLINDEKVRKAYLGE